MSKSAANVIITKTHVQINDDDGEEIVYWDHAEWEEDPSLAVTIAQYIQDFYVIGPVELKDRMSKNGAIFGL
jgi:hypothetical protein